MGRNVEERVGIGQRAGGSSVRRFGDGSSVPRFVGSSVPRFLGWPRQVSLAESAEKPTSRRTDELTN
jgi:hypothetical protein